MRKLDFICRHQVSDFIKYNCCHSAGLLNMHTDSWYNIQAFYMIFKYKTDQFSHEKQLYNYIVTISAMLRNKFI